LYNPLAHLGICISAEKYDDVDSCEELVDWGITTYYYGMMWPRVWCKTLSFPFISLDHNLIVSLYMLISFTSMRCSIGWRLVPLNFYFRLSYLYARLMYYVCTDYLQLMLLQVQLEQSTLACIVQMPNKYNRSGCSFVWVLRFVANKILVITLYKFLFWSYWLLQKPSNYLSPTFAYQL
jgi:hypothetical protein